MKFTEYKRTNVAQMRPYVPGEDLTGVSVSATDTPEEGGMIARNPENTADQWYVAPAYFAENFEPATSAHAPVKGYTPMSPEQIGTMNLIKEMGADIGEVIRLIGEEETRFDIDRRFLAIAKTHLQQGFMCLTRSVANPEFF